MAVGIVEVEARRGRGAAKSDRDSNFVDWGGSLTVRLPKRLVQEMGLAPGDELAIVEVSKAALTVERVDRRAQFLKRMEQFRWPAPEDYVFDRVEANAR